MIGVHVSKTSPLMRKSTGGSLDEAIISEQQAFAAHGVKLSAAQIYTHGPRTYAHVAINEKKLAAISRGTRLIVHSTYLSVAIWKYHTLPDGKRRHVYGHIESQFDVCDAIGARCLILHLPRATPFATVKRVLGVLETLTDKYNTQLVLEIVPDKSSQSYARIENLVALVHHLSDYGGDIGICIDTAHLWGAGIDSGDYKIMAAYLRRIPFPELVSVIHLNGSDKKTFASNRDVHQIALGPNDDIFTGRVNTLRLIAKFARANDCCVICEINRGDRADMCEAMKYFQAPSQKN